MKLTEKYETESGEKALYRKGASDYHTLKYVRWLEEKVSPTCNYPRCGGPEIESYYDKRCICGEYPPKAGKCPIHG